jgi:hypothetical protein
MAWPIVDGWVIPDDQYRLYEAGQFNDTPILVGYNSDEGLSFTRVRTSEEYVAGVRARYGPFADRLLEAYPTAGGGVPKTARDLARDSAFGWHTWSWARLQSSRGKGKAFLYYFDQHPERAPGSPEADHGAPHGVDVPFVFGNLDAAGKPITPDDQRISDAMATYWTRFAKRGDPNGDGLPTWPAFGDSQPVVMHFSSTPKTVLSCESLLRVLTVTCVASLPEAAAGTPSGNSRDHPHSGVDLACALAISVLSAAVCGAAERRGSHRPEPGLASSFVGVLSAGRPQPGAGQARHRADGGRFKVAWATQVDFFEPTKCGSTSTTPDRIMDEVRPLATGRGRSSASSTCVATGPT